MTPSAIERVKSSIEIARRFLKSAERTFEIGDYVMVEIAAYNSAFHSVRALLFAKGYKERSHQCLVIAVRELYRTNPKIVELMNIFDKLRISRHNVQYGGALVDEEEAEFVLRFAREVLEIVEQLV
ncbi:MAG TPA: HEPN domain-containing protein [Thermococcaceae archaeon]|uniref:HEPN domain protein n=2 Tax=Thermococcus sibiricus TaxID=172049 RepID=C6A0E2_THESM|nr:HEPN domain-containing protein [Thermococcus sibiricus]ACS89087.1 HEPN domain protein [Thermococcus sibiricus MM 739]HII67787.1 HEPN domain-containing protein [Thermococcaceae archaeon]